MKLIKEELDRQGRKTSWLADQCAVSVSTMRHFLSGRRTASPPVLKLMFIALNLKEPENAKTA